jgi:hypothetical protein
VNVVETILVFVGIPLAIVLVLAALTLLPGGRRPRYRPGQPWEHEPIWYEPHPEGPAAGHGTGHGTGHGAGHGPATAIGSSVYPERPAIGSGEHGAGAAPAPQPAGPLGGARGTW